MITKNRKCKYRNCGKLIPFNAHGSSEYCPSPEDEKESCSYKERLLRRPEYIHLKEEGNRRKAELRIILKNLISGHSFKHIQFEVFSGLITMYIDLMTRDFLKGSAYYHFEDFKIFKIRIGEMYLVKIEKNKQDEKYT